MNSARRFRWGIFGTGPVAAKFVTALSRLPDAQVGLVASRRAEQAQRFAGAFGIQRAIGGFDEAAAQAPGLVDAIYIATPPALHREHALLCLEAGLPVLVEKPLAGDAASAKAIADAARAKGLFCMEAMWTRFLPAALRFRDLVRKEAVGAPHLVTGSFGSSNAVDPQYGNFDPARGGGALAHLGFYPISLGQWLFGAPSDVAATGRIGATGVEEDAAIAIRYRGGVIGSFHTTLRAPARNDFAVLGTHGRLSFQGPIYRPWGVERVAVAPSPAPMAGLGRKQRLRESHSVQRLAQIWSAARGNKARTERHFFEGNGYQYEAAEAAARISGGFVESEIMPLSDSIAVATTLQAVRDQIGRQQGAAA